MITTIIVDEMPNLSNKIKISEPSDLSRMCREIILPHFRYESYDPEGFYMNTTFFTIYEGILFYSEKYLK